MGGMLAAAGGLAVLWRKPAARTAVQDAIPGLAARVKSVARGNRSASSGTGDGAGSASRDEGDEASRRQPWRCECGQDYLVSGQDRHQIYWLDGADQSDPVLSDHCPNCDRPLPAASLANATG